MRLATTLLLGGLALLVLIPTALQYADQNRQYRAAVTEVEVARERTIELQEELANWDNPEYVASQARSRLGYVRKGETQFSVVDATVEEAAPEATVTSGPPKPWTMRLHGSLLDVDQPPAVAEIVKPQG